MIISWILIGLMLVVAIALTVGPLFRKTGNQGPDPKELNLLLHRQRMGELETDRENALLSPDEFEQARLELEQQLLSDFHESSSSDKNTGKHSSNFWTATILAVLLPVAALGIYWQLGDWGSLDPAHTPAPTAAVDAAEQSTDMPPLDALIGLLEERLKNQPDDLEGWTMLARSYGYLQRYDDANRTYGLILPMIDNPGPALLLDYAESLAMANSGSLTDRSKELITQALELAPQDPKALWLAGMAAFQKSEFSLALQHWEQLRTITSPDDEEAQILNNYIGQARSHLTGEPMKANASDPAIETPAVIPDAATTAPVSLTVSVRLDPGMAKNTADSDTVFVFARAASGPRMPLAIVRKQVKDLPITVTLDDSQAMMPAMKLSNFQEVVVGARISKSGNAMPQSGDLHGDSGTIGTDIEKTIPIVINQIQP